MEKDDIKILRNVLLYKKQNRLAELFDGCFSEINQSGQFGSKYNATLSEFLIYAPIEKYFELKNLNGTDQQVILESILDIYPVVDEALEITSVQYRLLKEEKTIGLVDAPTFAGRNLRVFVSYSDKDKELAGGIKRGLEILGIDVFLAHEDITPSAEWVETILENLDSTDIFIPIITKNFQQSDWTDQESGIAFAKNKTIVPVSIDGCHPYGFINKFQSAKIPNENKYRIPCGNIIEALIKIHHKKFAGVILPILVNAFEESHSYDNAGEISKLLTLYEDIDKDHIVKIFNSILDNSQIYESYSAKPNLKILLRKYSDRVDQKIAKKVVEKIELS